MSTIRHSNQREAIVTLPPIRDFDDVDPPLHFAAGTREYEPVSLASRPDAVEYDGLHALDVAMIVHDLKSPLATIALEICLLDEQLDDQADTELSSALGRVSHNVEFLDRLVQDLLDSCAIDMGQFAVQRRTTELRGLLAQVIDRVVSTRDRGRVLLEAPCPIMLSIDDLRIERVVANLVQNALKYAPKASGIAIRLDVDQHFARVSVTDAGPGMTANEKGYIFDKYRRGAGARALEGSGLGLYVAKQIIVAHGGHIGVDSVHGVGSRFFFDLPVA